MPFFLGQKKSFIVPSTQELLSDARAMLVNILLSPLKVTRTSSSPISILILAPHNSISSCAYRISHLTFHLRTYKDLLLTKERDLQSSWRSFMWAKLMVLIRVKKLPWVLEDHIFFHRLKDIYVWIYTPTMFYVTSSFFFFLLSSRDFCAFFLCLFFVLSLPIFFSFSTSLPACWLTNLCAGILISERQL